MKLTTKIQHAINRASKLHQNQLRYDAEKTPHIAHLISVAILVAEHTDDEDTIVAAIMHDSIEDVPDYTISDLTTEFGDNVSRMVSSLSEDTTMLDWKERKYDYLNNIKQGGINVAIISLADKVHNFEGMIEMWKSDHNIYWANYFKDISHRLEFYEDLYMVFESYLPDHPLLIRHKKSLEYIKESIAK